jgi:hypothetical protein
MQQTPGDDESGGDDSGGGEGQDGEEEESRGEDGPSEEVANEGEGEGTTEHTLSFLLMTPNSIYLTTSPLFIRALEGGSSGGASGEGSSSSGGGGGGGESSSSISSSVSSSSGGASGHNSGGSATYAVHTKQQQSGVLGLATAAMMVAAGIAAIATKRKVRHKHHPPLGMRAHCVLILFLCFFFFSCAHCDSLTIIIATTAIRGRTTARIEGYCRPTHPTLFPFGPASPVVGPTRYRPVGQFVRYFVRCGSSSCDCCVPTATRFGHCLKEREKKQQQPTTTTTNNTQLATTTTIAETKDNNTFMTSFKYILNEYSGRR